ncbi:MAG: hypothetical protein KGI00_01410 [Candidatus Micrarchaeota archaeon]|nr:hypothetical protein [Candidatus Micrarchaeota archaeon]MDE1824226.1 hypothetical protein [Candidatus Micrarchaeota archaeon]MDE1849367.1 hypothetical protein [Candidatus Micrarchaeota archaeon]
MHDVVRAINKQIGRGCLQEGPQNGIKVVGFDRKLLELARRPGETTLIQTFRRVVNEAIEADRDAQAGDGKAQRHGKA